MHMDTMSADEKYVLTFGTLVTRDAIEEEARGREREERNACVAPSFPLADS